jgi:AraC-like DNA-binding protein
MEVKLYQPRNPLLQRYIECFYTLSRRPDEEPVTYIAFPSIFSMVCLNLKTRIEIAKNNLKITSCTDNALETILMCNFDNAGRVHYEGETDEIVIYFKPMGINAFLDQDLRDHLSSSCVYFAPFEDYKTRMTEIFSLQSGAERILSLEDYWLAKLKDFQHPFLHNVIDEMLNNNSSSSISRIARNNCISRTTLNKHFDLHLCTTPSRFRKVARFRNAIKRHQKKSSRENLADISHSTEYFDQSHMIKDFKALTSYTPKAFFPKITNLENGTINWVFL